MREKDNVKKRAFVQALAISLILIGLIGFYLFIYKGWNPAFLHLKVFTLYSKYLETKTLQLITNQQGDELSVLLYGVGLILLFINKNKQQYGKIAALIIVYIAAYLLLHGLAIVYFTFIFLFMLPVVFILFQFNTSCAFSKD